MQIAFLTSGLRDAVTYYYIILLYGVLDEYLFFHTTHTDVRFRNLMRLDFYYRLPTIFQFFPIFKHFKFFLLSE